MQDAFDTLSGLISPQAAVAHNQAIRDAASAASVDAAKGQNKLANDIALANVNSANTINENAAKAEAENPVKRAAGIRDLYKSLEDNNGFPAAVGADGKPVELTADQKMAKAAELYDANIAAARRLSVGTSPFGQGAPILASRPAAPPTASAPASPDDVISAKSRAWWQRNGVSLPWWQSQPAAPAAPRALGILPPQAPPGPGSVNSYETRNNLANIPDVPYAAPEVLRHPMAGAAPASGEGVDAYEQRLGLAQRRRRARPL